VFLFLLYKEYQLDDGPTDIRDHSLIGWPRTNNYVLGHVHVLIKQKFKPIRDTGTAVECRTTWSHSCFNKPKFIQYYYTGIFGVLRKIGIRSSSVAGAQFVAARGCHLLAFLNTVIARYLVNFCFSGPCISQCSPSRVR
jgi:hypothetical protein